MSGFDKLVQDPNFSNFEFWRSPIPSVPGSDLGEVEGERSKVDSESGTRGNNESPCIVTTEYGRTWSLIGNSLLRAHLFDMCSFQTIQFKGGGGGGMLY